MQTSKVLIWFFSSLYKKILIFKTEAQLLSKVIATFEQQYTDLISINNFQHNLTITVCKM